MRPARRALLVASGVGSLAWSCGLRAAARYPDKPVRMIVAFPPGGGTDIVARLVASRMSHYWNEQIIVDNRAGAGGVIGTEAAARSPADGYTMLMATLGNLSINPHLYPMNVDPIKDLAPVTKVVDVNFVLVANPRLGVNSVQDLIAMARAKPSQLTYSSSGVGGAPHLAGELFCDLARVKMMHVPYKGSGPSFTDLLGGQVQCTFDSLVQALPYVKENRLRALAVLGPKRSRLLPDVPTMQEAGVEGYAFTNWFGLVAPAGTPPEAIRSMHDTVARTLAEPAIQQQLEQMGADPALMEPEQFGHIILADSQKWARIIKEKGIKS